VHFPEKKFLGCDRIWQTHSLSWLVSCREHWAAEPTSQWYSTLCEPCELCERYTERRHKSWTELSEIFWKRSRSARNRLTRIWPFTRSCQAIPPLFELEERFPQISLVSAIVR